MPTIATTYTAPAPPGTAIDVTEETYSPDLSTYVMPAMTDLLDITAIAALRNITRAYLYSATDDTYTDYTAEAISADPNDCPLLPDPPEEEDAFYIGSTGKFDWTLFEIGTAGVGSFSFVEEYWNGSAWVAPITHVDSTTSFKAADEQSLITWQPDDWERTSVNGDNLMWVRWRQTVVTPSFTTKPLADRIRISVYAMGYLNTRQTYDVIPGVQQMTHLFTVIPERGGNFNWTFKLAEEDDYATPKTGVAGIAVQISKDGAAFANVSNTVTEIGSGWYRVQIDAADTNVNVLICKATASGCAQCDEIYYPMNQ